MVRRRTWFGIAIATALFVATVTTVTIASFWAPFKDALRGYGATISDDLRVLPNGWAAKSAEERGGYFVVHGDFGTLTTENLHTNAVPWKLLAVLPDVVPEPFFANGQRGWQPVKGEPLARFGLVYSARIVGPAALVQIHDYRDSPVGYVHGQVHRRFPDLTLELAGLMCATCHAGRGWDDGGHATHDVYWGTPNHSIDFDALVAAIAAATADPRATDRAITDAMRLRFPAVTDDELGTYRRYILPAFRRVLRETNARWGGLHPWKFGGPGLSHGIAIVHEGLDTHPELLRTSDFPAAYTKIPNVYGVLAKDHMLIDGSYASPTRDHDARFVDFLTGFLPVLGAAPDRAVAERSKLPDVVAFLKGLRPAAFPGKIDARAASRGQGLYAERCKGCHGGPTGDGGYTYPNRHLRADAVGTDPTRATALTPVLVGRFNLTAVGQYMRVEATGEYVPPSLLGVWAQAPYFHNGSVPTLWDVLSPSERPTVFWVGGNALDLRKVGIALDAEGHYPETVVPWSEPQVRDTRQPGFSNGGHTFGLGDLTDAMKWDLVEYMKTL